jgi:hypothetical protein
VALADALAASLQLHINSRGTHMQQLHVMQTTDTHTTPPPHTLTQVSQHCTRPKMRGLWGMRTLLWRRPLRKA